jgi:hypothetical protein
VTTAPALHNVPLDCTLPIHRRRTRRPAAEVAPPGFMAEPLVVEDPGGWIAAGDLVSGERLASLFELPQRLWGAPAYAAAVLAWKVYSYRLAQALATAWALAREIPLLSADNVLLQILPGAPYLILGLRRGTSAVLSTSPASRSHDAVVLPDESTQLAFFRNTLIDEHLRPLLERTRKVQCIGERELWGQAAAAIAYAFADISATAGQDTALFTDALPFPGLAGVGEDGRVWRNTCCQAFASPSLPTCRDCVTR